MLELQITPVLKEKSLRNANPIQVACEINKVTGMVKGVGKQGCSLVVECFNTKQVAQLIQTTVILKTEVKVSRFTPTVGPKGVIKGTDPEIKDNESENIALEQYGVVEAKK